MFISITQPTIPKRMGDKGGWGPYVEYANPKACLPEKKTRKSKEKKNLLIIVSDNSKWGYIRLMIWTSVPIFRSFQVILLFL